MTAEGAPPGQFTFFRSFYEAMAELEDKERLAFFDAMMAYAFEGVIPEFDSFYLRMAWSLIEPNIQKSIKQSITNANNRRKKKAENDDGNDRKNDRVNDRKNGRKNASGNDGGNARSNDAENRENGRFAGKDKEKDKDRDGDTERMGNHSLENDFPSVANESCGPPRCPIDGCDGTLTWDAKSKRLWCPSCRSSFMPQDLGSRAT